jgi:hypothetical protein
LPRGTDDCFDDAHEIAGDQYVRQRGEESRKTAVAAGWRCEFSGGDLVWPPLDGDGANPGEVCFRGRLGTSSFGFVFGANRAGTRAAFTAYGFGDE